jgi:hypothetical protein
MQSTMAAAMTSEAILGRSLKGNSPRAQSGEYQNGIKYTDRVGPFGSDREGC